MNEFVAVVVTPATKSSMYASESEGVTALIETIGFTAPVILPLPSTATESFRSKSNARPMTALALTVSGLVRFTVADDCVSDAAGDVVEFNVVIVGRVGGVVWGFVTFMYTICGFANVMLTLVYESAGIVFRSSKVWSPSSRAKSTVWVPFRTEIGGLTPSDTVMPVMST